MKHAVAILFLFGGFAIAADDADSKKLLKDLQGSYKMTAAEKAGGPPDKGFLDSIDGVSIKGDKFSIRFKADNAKVEEKSATITVDAAKKPVQIDLKSETGDMMLGIIFLNEDILKICFCDAMEAKRPADFKTSKDDKNLMLTLKRIKE